MKIPTVEEIEEYMNEKGCFVEDEAELFYCYYDQVGWVTGKARTPMKKWKSAVSGWLIRNKRRYQSEQAKRNQPGNTFADRQRQQANQAMQELEAVERGNGEAGLRVVR